MTYEMMSAEALKSEQAKLLGEYEDIKARGLTLDLSRGKPSREQLDLMTGMLTVLSKDEDCFAEN